MVSQYSVRAQTMYTICLLVGSIGHELWCYWSSTYTIIWTYTTWTDRIASLIYVKTSYQKVVLVLWHHMKSFCLSKDPPQEYIDTIAYTCSYGHLLLWILGFKFSYMPVLHIKIIMSWGKCVTKPKLVLEAHEQFSLHFKYNFNTAHFNRWIKLKNT